MFFRGYAPAGLEDNLDYSVTYRYADREGSLTCKTALVNNRFTDLTESVEKMSFTSFDCDFDSPVEIVVKPRLRHTRGEIRPAKLSIPFTFDGEELRLTLHKPQKISIEFDGDLYHNLFIFANYPNQKPEGADVIVYGPGAHHEGVIRIGSNQTLWLDGDATVFGCIVAEGENIRVLGRGVLTGVEFNHDYRYPRRQLFRIDRSRNVEVEGILLTDSPAWTFVTSHSEHIHVHNLKQICHHGNSDGFDICATRHVLIEDCFVRNWDDSISIKSFAGKDVWETLGKTECEEGIDTGDNVDIICRDTVMWADRAHNMLIGPEAQKGRHNQFRHIVFENIIVLEHEEYSEEFQGVMAIFCADDADFSDIIWRNITIERMTHGRAFDFRYVTLFAENYGRSCKNILVENVDCYAPVLYRNRILGLDEKHTMNNITIKNVKMQGRKIQEHDPSVEVNDFTSGVYYE